MLCIPIISTGRNSLHSQVVSKCHTDIRYSVVAKGLLETNECSYTGSSICLGTYYASLWAACITEDEKGSGIALFPGSPPT